MCLSNAYRDAPTNVYYLYDLKYIIEKSFETVYFLKVLEIHIISIDNNVHLKKKNLTNFMRYGFDTFGRVNRCLCITR